MERTPPCSHRVIIQDDAELCTDFKWALEQAVTARPDNILALFVPTTLRIGAQHLLEACARDEAFCALHITEWVPVVALAWPYDVIGPFLEWCDRKAYSLAKYRADDAVVGEFVRETGRTVYATVPSLVEHPDDVESTIGMKNRVPRRAVCFAGENAHRIDWSS